MLASPLLAVRGTAAPALHVVALDLLVAEQLLTLGAPPFACANIPLYERLVASPPLPAATVDVGTLQEPNRELLQSLKPDLIIGMAWQGFRQEELTRIAEVLWMPPPKAGVTPIAYIEQMLISLAERTGRQEAAIAANNQLDAALAATRDAVGTKIRRPVFFLRFMENGRHAAVCGSRSMIGDAAVRMGLSNAWTGRGNASGVAAIGIEELAAAPEALIVHFDRGVETARAMARLSRSPFWNALPAVAAGRVVSMPVIHPNGGVHSAVRFARQTETLLTARTDLHG
ncbi:ABC transporter substrate-binding protein [Azorhizobium oxalatiphilum]|uniref:ABC transporter substrate-binding protein n=1 Tax=Azorhizobium oxalatiphilum TaxID=980631 RepID=A0A917BTN2_9HYPH|nr:ABC transporter substrate-binding protein [Azorhizobium oxalatiphilum]GGF58297.1 ABC transporter substrate-binding protein [Azorhizobium oxalatiphilum]